MKMLIVDFRNFANSPKNSSFVGFHAISGTIRRNEPLPFHSIWLHS
jgi:hypothetical protein